MLVVNGQYPGPAIIADWGDTIQVTVNNELQDNGTSFHWHGLRQLHSNDMDGVNGITECPLAPGASKTYSFQATEYGTSWYHSHFSLQYGDGVVGPIIINGPAAANYDEDLGTIMVSDFYEGKGAVQLEFEELVKGPPNATNYLLNGQNMTPDGSSGTRPEWIFEAGKKYLMRFVNPSIDNHFKLQLDGHTMQVITTDFVPIVPYSTTTLNIGIGQRYDVVVEADQVVGAYFLRAINQVECGVNYNNGLGNANGIIRYKGSDESAEPTSVYVPYKDACEDEPLASTVPYVSKTVDPSTFAAQASTLPVNLSAVDIGGETLYRWFLNENSMKINWSEPTLMQVASGKSQYNIPTDVSYNQSESLVILPNANVWTFWIIQNELAVPHPMHLHGHDFSLLGNGNGTFTASMQDQLNFSNPPRRDVTLLTASGWSVIAFQTDNPGAWLMHCHIAYHVADGLSLQFLEVPSEIPNIYGESSANFRDTCDKWDAYFYSVSPPVYNETLSGL